VHRSISSRLSDQPGEVRDGETLDTSRLEPYLRAHLPGFDGTLQVAQFRRGHSNLTYLISDGTRDWVLRRPPFGEHAPTAHDMGREYRILCGLHRALDVAPEALLYCDDSGIVGAPFYVMRRLEGVILRSRVPDAWDDGPSLRGALCETWVATLARIHGADVSVGGIADLGKPDGYIERQIQGWTARYRRAQTDEIDAVEEIASWLAVNQPAERRATLIHNDFKYDNIVLDPENPSRVLGVLDWEMATRGDPWMDVGTSLGYWVEPNDPPEVHALPFGVPPAEGTWSRAEVVARYADLRGEGVPDWRFYYVYGLFKIAVVAQQIYKRFATGKTTDPRFAMMITGVHVLAGQGRRQLDET